ncbi:MAG: glycine--tRNA ligase subunit beta [Candidatus Omnitrophica bacterium]|nr:glycine--tRNA ligase subunit beta [Candidatus Omnitrophota bacterium]
MKKPSKRSTSHVPRPTSQTSDLLLEIGTEELPAAYLPGLIDQLGTEAKALLEANHLAFKQVESFGTPRRLVLLVRGLDAIQRKPSEEIRGPSKQAAYDAAGKPTQALLGFLRSRDGSLEQIKIVSSDKGEYVYLSKPETTASFERWLPGWPGLLIQWLKAPKTMRWDNTNLRFARPIRWLLALYGTTPIRCTVNLASAPYTRVGRPQALRPVRVTSIPDYFQTLKRSGILLDQDERRRRIQQSVGREARRVGGVVAPEMLSHGLLEEVTYLTESPVALTGSFDPTYLELPREVLLASMAKYQRVFALEANGKLLPKLVAILEGKPGKPAAVRAVIERILNARLADSLLFFEADKQQPLANANLSRVTFHEKLGSMEEKTQRVWHLSSALGEMWGLTQQELHHLQRACLLAKADLVTSLVREFPTLQGVMGTYYARASGEPEPVAQAIEEHYLPLAGKSPTTLIGSALAILDKYDTLASYFSIGIEPTGDQDPFGLRRATQGIVEVAWKIHRPLPLDGLFAAWQPTAPYAAGKDQVREPIRRYLLERLYTFDWPPPKPAQDYIDAVLSSSCEDLVDAMDRIVSLRKLDGHPGLRQAAKVIERTQNILKGAPARPRTVDPSRLQQPQERKLWELCEQKGREVTQLAKRKSYAEATRLFGSLFFEPLHEFFDRVMVNVPDEPIRENRLALMEAINALYTGRIADLSKLTLLQQNEET